MASRDRDSTPTYDERRYLRRVDRSGLRVLDVRAALAALDKLTPEELADLLYCDTEPANT
jgi:hypothetical protein